MAKSVKKDNSKKQPNLKELLRQKGRQFPLGPCYMSERCEHTQEATAIVTRCRSNGNFLIAVFNVNPTGRGIVGCKVESGVTPEALSELCCLTDVKPVAYERLHNYLLGAVEFAAEAGFDPAPGYDTAELLLEEDTDEIPVIDFDFGVNGGDHVVVYDPERESLTSVRQAVGNRPCRILTTDEFARLVSRQYGTFISESYSYKGEYPISLSPSEMNDLFELVYHDKFKPIAPEDMKRLTEWPRPELVRQLRELTMWETGHLLGDIKTGVSRHSHSDALINIMAILIEIKDPQTQHIVLEVMKQPRELIDIAFGEAFCDILSAAMVFTTDYSNLHHFISYLKMPGIDSEIRGYAFALLENLTLLHRDLADTIRAEIHNLLQYALENIAYGKGTDSTAAAHLIDSAASFGDKSMLPVITQLFDTGLIRTDLCGTLEDVTERLAEASETGNGPIGVNIPTSAEELYDRLL